MILAVLSRVAGWALLLGGLCVTGVGVQAQTGVAGERQRVADERAAVESRYRAQEAACQQRFAVTDCVNDAKKERRDALTPLRRLDAALDDAQRKQRAAQRREEIARKLESTQTRDREVVVREAPAAAAAPAVQPAAPAETASAPARAPREARPKAPPKRASARTPSAPPTAAERHAREAEAQARSVARKQSAQDHKEAVEQRNAERALRGKRVAPLPVPASGALP
jgi:colicin import membrane protein